MTTYFIIFVTYVIKITYMKIEYKYPPIYKYVIFFVLVYMFIKHQRLISQDKLLLLTTVIVLILAALDYMIIRNHPSLLETNNDTSEMDEDIEDIIKSIDEEEDSEEQESHDNSENEYNVKINRNKYDDNRAYYSSDNLLAY